jgi:hypothetical protein
MKKVVFLVLLGLLIFSVPDLSWAKKEKTGKVKGNTFTDSKFGYQLTFLSNWKLKDEKEPSLVRASLTQKNYEMDPGSRISRSDFNIPTILILADTTSLPLEEFREALFTQDTKKISNRDEYHLRLDFLSGSEIVKESEALVDSIPAKILTLGKPFERALDDPTQTHAPLGSVRIIKEFLAGYLVVFKYEKNVYVVQLSCERQFFGVSHEEFTRIMQGWRFQR